MLWQSFLNMSEHYFSSSKIYLFFFENIQNSLPNPGISLDLITEYNSPIYSSLMPMNLYFCYHLAAAMQQTTYVHLIEQKWVSCRPQKAARVESSMYKNAGMHAWQYILLYYAIVLYYIVLSPGILTKKEWVQSLLWSWHVNW